MAVQRRRSRGRDAEMRLQYCDTDRFEARETASPSPRALAVDAPSSAPMKNRVSEVEAIDVLIGRHDDDTQRVLRWLACMAT